MSSVKEKAIAIIADQLEVDEQEIKESSHFQNDLGADSLDLTEMIMAFEEAFDIEISDEEAMELTTVGSVLQKLEALTTA
ncbi:MAG: acyl carrier protein [Patescibacteria group bacterium]